MSMNELTGSLTIELERVSDTQIVCSKCGMTYFIYDHYSERAASSVAGAKRNVRMLWQSVAICGVRFIIVSSCI